MEEQQLLDEDPRPVSTSEGQVCHITEGQSSTKVGYPGVWGTRAGGQPVKDTIPEAARLHSQLTISISDCSLEHSAHIEHIGPDDLEPRRQSPR